LLYGIDLNVRTRAFYYGPITIDFLGGIRYFDVDQKITARTSLTLSQDPNGPQRNVNNGVVGDPNSGTIITTGGTLS